jgi:hypothetical protein
LPALSAGSRRRQPKYRAVPIEDSIKLLEKLHDLPRPASRFVAKKTGMEYDSLEGDDVIISYTTKDGQMQKILQAIPEAEEHFKRLQRHKKSGRGNPKEIDDVLPQETIDVG